MVYFSFYFKFIKYKSDTKCIADDLRSVAPWNYPCYQPVSQNTVQKDEK